ncbi:MAG: ATP-binding protein [Bacteroidales bacterium]|nr:ATP-binding protein [Bacteroidales bacterium]
MKIAIASGKGGTGKTLISTNLFYTLSQDYKSLCLLDCDAEEPNDVGFFETQLINEDVVTQKVPVIDESLCTYCGKCHDYCAYNAIFIIPPSKVIKVIEDLCHGCGACTVACEFGAITEKDVVLGNVNKYVAKQVGDLIETRVKVGVYSPVKVIKAGIKATEKYDFVILDAPPGTSCPFIHTVAAADFVVLITEPTPFGLSDLKQSVETLKTMDKKYGVIINRAGLGDRDIYKYLEEEQIPLLMEIPFEKEIALIYSTGQLLAEHRPEFKIELKNMFEKIISDYGNSSN